MDAYEKMTRETASGEGAWYPLPADNKWFTRVIVARATVIDALSSLDLGRPKVDETRLGELEQARKALLSENSRPHPDAG